MKLLGSSSYFSAGLILNFIQIGRYLPIEWPHSSHNRESFDVEMLGTATLLNAIHKRDSAMGHD
jgi:hypothetical protein